MTMDEVAKKYGIYGKLSRAEDLIAELEPLLDELRVYGFCSPDIYMAPFGNTINKRGGEFVKEYFAAYLRERGEDKKDIKRAVYECCIRDKARKKEIGDTKSF